MEAIKNIKPLYKIIIFGLIPLIILAMFIFKPKDIDQLTENKSDNPFFKNPEQKKQKKKSNIDFYNKNKFSSKKKSSFGDGLTFETKKNETKEIIDTVTVIEEVIPEEPKTKIIYRSKTYTSKTTKPVEEAIQKKKRRRGGGSSNGNMTGKKTSSLKSSSTINAVIHNGNKTIKSGSTVKMRTSKGCIINGFNIKKNTMFSGVASFQNERLEIKVNSIDYYGKIISCNFSVYDNDGILGLYVPGGINQEVKEGAASDAISEGGAKINIPVFGSISTGALKKKVKDPSVLVYDNHKITLR